MENPVENLLMEVFKSVATQGPLVAFLFYLYIQNDKKITTKEERIDKQFDALAHMQREAILAITNNTAQSQRLAEAIEDMKVK